LKVGSHYQVSSNVSVYSLIEKLVLDSGFFFDYNNNRRVLSVDVLSAFHELFGCVSSKSMINIDVNVIETPQNLYKIFMLLLRPGPPYGLNRLSYVRFILTMLFS